MNFVSATKRNGAKDINQEEREIPELYRMDARNIGSIIAGRQINLTLTSPPYFDVKDYGADGQLGFGQTYGEYLSDLKAIFEEIYVATEEGGSLWIVIDTFRRDGELIPLPFDLAEKLKEVGWALKDVIIWKKDRTLPWTKNGTTRNIFEYMMVFAKNAKVMKYFADRVRDHTDLKHWWVRYPERYNPRGKSLEEVWCIDIPVQGSWGSAPRHSCPLPPALVRRVIRLTTDEADVVLDPFAGTGVVLSQASRLGRRSLGCEIDPGLVDSFRSRLYENIERGEERSDSSDDESEFQRKIIDLRVLKFGRLLLRALRKACDVNDLWLFVELSARKPVGKFALAAANYVVVATTEEQVSAASAKVVGLITRRPLSKFGLDAGVQVVTESQFSATAHSLTEVYGYSIDNTHKYKAIVHNLGEGRNRFAVLSRIGMSIDEDPEY